MSVCDGRSSLPPFAADHPPHVPEAAFVTIPVVSQIIPRLFQGSFMYVEGVQHFDVIVNLSAIPQSAPTQFRGLYIEWPIDDGNLPSEEVIRGLAKLLAGLWKKDQTILVHCAAGLNRSGLVVGRTLMEIGFNSKRAIAMMRRQRSEYCLCNTGFENWLHSEDRGRIVPPL